MTFVFCFVQLSMSNVSNRSNLLWIHCLMAWVVTLVVYNVSLVYPPILVLGYLLVPVTVVTITLLSCQEASCVPMSAVFSLIDSATCMIPM